MIAEIGWFYLQGRLIGRFPMERWLVICAAATALRLALTGGLGESLVALVIAQAVHALTFATHHTACISMVTTHFPGRLRARGQALFTVIGYGFGGVVGSGRRRHRIAMGLPSCCRRRGAGVLRGSLSGCKRWRRCTANAKVSVHESAVAP